MAFEPINYAIDVKSPFEAAAQGYATGAAIRDDQFKQQQLALQLQQQQALQLQQQQALQAAARPNATFEDYRRASLLVPSAREAIEASWKILNPNQQQAELSHGASVFGALLSQRPDVAAQLLNGRADALENSGNKAEAQHQRMLAQQVATDPNGVRTQIGITLGALPGGDKIIENANKMAAEQRAQDQAPGQLRKVNADATTAEAKAANAPQQEAAQARLTTAQAGKAEVDAANAPAMAAAEIRLKNSQVNNIASEITDRTRRFGLDSDIRRSEIQIKAAELQQKLGQLPDDARKLVNDSAVQGVASEQQATQFADLAGKIDQLSGSWGKGSSAHEWIKRATGSEDAVSALKREYTRMASSGVLKLLPPGPASDKDIQLAREGVPDANASPDVMAAYLRGMAKLSAYDAALNQAKTDWVGQNQTLGAARADLSVNDIKVPKGATFADFSRQFLANKAAAITGGATVQGRSYMRFAAPPASPGALGSGTYGAQ